MSSQEPGKPIQLSFDIPTAADQSTAPTITLPTNHHLHPKHQDSILNMPTSQYQQYKPNFVQQQNFHSMHTPTVESPPKNQPKIEKSKNNNKLNIMSKDNQELKLENRNVPQSTSKDQLSQATNEIKIEKTVKKDSLKFSKCCTDINKIMEMLDSYAHSKNVFTRHSKGYISLMAYLKDKGNSSSAPSSSSGGFQGDATLVEANESRYVPPNLIKKAEMWEDDSEDGFMYSLNLALNKITESQVLQIAKQIQEHIHSDNERDLASKVLIQKALGESHFLLLYAKLTKELNDEILQNNILRQSQLKYEDFIINPPTNEAEGQAAKNSAGFIAFLIEEDLISPDAGIDNLRSLLKNIDENLDSQNSIFLVEMLKAFVINSGKEFVNSVQDSDWEIFRAMLNRVPMNSMKGCYFMDIQDQLDEYRSQESKQAINEKDLHHEEKTIEDTIRDYFCDFEEQSQIKVNEMNCTSEEFLQCAISQLPSYSKNCQNYSLFVASTFTLLHEKENRDIATDLMIKYAQEITKQEIYKDYPKIWNAFFVLLVALYAYGAIPSPNKVIDEFPNSSEINANWDNEAKYLLYDFSYFTYSYPVKHVSQEISDAIKMPDIISTRAKDSNFSRLIAVAICRVIINHINQTPDKIKEILDKYGSQLSVVYKNYRSVYEEEFDLEYVPKDRITELLNQNSY